MSRSIFSAPHFNDEAAAYAYIEARIWVAALARIVACSNVPRRLKEKAIGLASTNATLAASRSP